MTGQGATACALALGPFQGGGAVCGCFGILSLLAPYGGPQSNVKIFLGLNKKLKCLAMGGGPEAKYSLGPGHRERGKIRPVRIRPTMGHTRLGLIWAQWAKG